MPKRALNAISNRPIGPCVGRGTSLWVSLCKNGAVGAKPFFCFGALVDLVPVDLPFFYLRP